MLYLGFSIDSLGDSDEIEGLLCVLKEDVVLSGEVRAKWGAEKDNFGRWQPKLVAKFQNLRPSELQKFLVDSRVCFNTSRIEVKLIREGENLESFFKRFDGVGSIGFCMINEESPELPN